MLFDFTSMRALSLAERTRIRTKGSLTSLPVPSRIHSFDHQPERLVLSIPPVPRVCGWRAMTLDDDYQLTRRDDIGALVSRSGGVVGIRREAGDPPASARLVRGVKPEEPSIVWIVPRRSWRTHEFHEFLRQQARAVPDTSLEIQESDTCLVPSRSEVVAGEKKVAVGISLKRETANPDFVEEEALRPGQVLFA